MLPQQPRQNAPLFMRLCQEPLALWDRLYGFKHFSEMEIFLGTGWGLGHACPHPCTHHSS